MFEKTISPKTHNLLLNLGKSKLLKDAYLTGGTALALILGHRISLDLDFFSKKEFLVDQIITRLKKIANFHLEQREWQTVIGQLESVKFSLFYYDYQLIDRPIDYLGLKLAGIKDIAAMKINAISDRGLKRDFIDLYCILQKTKLNLGQILQSYDKKYGKLAANKLHILKSLVYFVDADPEPMPEMLKRISWHEVKKELINQVKKLV